jgi:hypothetical protein
VAGNGEDVIGPRALAPGRYEIFDAIWKRVACWLRISGIDGHAGPLFGRLAPSSQRLTRSSSACSESIAENLTISYPNIVGEFVDLYRVTPVEQMHCMLFHRPGPQQQFKEFFLVFDDFQQKAREAATANRVTAQETRAGLGWQQFRRNFIPLGTAIPTPLAGAAQ